MNKVMHTENPQSQQQVWNAIASEWSEFKTQPAENVLNFLKGKKGKVLDLGSGSGRHLIKDDNLELYLVDFSENMIKLAEKNAKEKNIKNAHFNVADLTKLPFEDNYFDYAVAMAVLHCIEKKEQKKTIKELHRVLKPKAEALIAVWNKDSKRFKNANKEKYVGWRDKGKRYYYLFDEKELKDLLLKSGFKIKDKIESEINIVFIVQK
jgi:ubiquinone/menaquinone biosynthesis C-methylase UbiE